MSVPAVQRTTESTNPAAFVGGLERADGGGGVPVWLAETRRRAAQRFSESGLPTPRVEAWKYTDLRGLAGQSFAPATDAAAALSDAAKAALSGLAIEGPRLVFVDGWFRADVSDLGGLPDGVDFGPLSKFLGDGADANLSSRAFELDDADDHSPLGDLNTALSGEGAVLRVSHGVTCAQPIHLVFVGGEVEKAACHPRNLIIVEEGAAAALVEHHVGGTAQAYFVNEASRIDVGAGAHLSHVIVQDAAQESYVLSAGRVCVADNAVYESFILTVGARLSRQEIAVRLVGQGAEVRLSGAYLLRGDQHADITTMVHHEVLNTSCHENFKGVVDDRARGVFQGNIIVHKGADKTDGHQSSKAILLSDDATAVAKPELEIYADDVKCSHGATTGELDAEALFYLRSRGISEARARALLIEAFVDEAIDGISNEQLRDAVRARSSRWLHEAT